jgi:hypothetical protein
MTEKDERWIDRLEEDGSVNVTSASALNPVRETLTFIKWLVLAVLLIAVISVLGFRWFGFEATKGQPPRCASYCRACPCP